MCETCGCNMMEKCKGEVCTDCGETCEECKCVPNTKETTPSETLEDNEGK
ncbi:MAG: hypothetical protein ABH956_01910 [Candidatus Nealsonbacteria bacterium]